MERNTIALVLLLLSFILTSCGSGGDDGALSGAQSAARELIESDPADIEAEFSLIEEATVRCMKGLGHDYVPQPFEPSPNRLRTPGEWLAVNLEDAQRIGYGLTDDALHFALLSAQRQQEFDSLSEDYLSVLWGTPEIEGCKEIAAGEVRGVSRGAPAEPVEALYDDYVSEVRSDSELVGMLDEWSVCMARTGLAVTQASDPIQLRRQLQAQIGTEVLEVLNDETLPASTDEALQNPAIAALLANEIQIASADAECQSAIGPRLGQRGFEIEESVLGFSTRQ